MTTKKSKIIYYVGNKNLREVKKGKTQAGLKAVPTLRELAKRGYVEDIYEGSKKRVPIYTR